MERAASLLRTIDVAMIVSLPLHKTCKGKACCSQVRGVYPCRRDDSIEQGGMAEAQAIPFDGAAVPQRIQQAAAVCGHALRRALA